MAYIELRDVTKRFGEFTAIGGLNISVEKGEFISVIGPSGAGKSTFLRLLNSTIVPEEGGVVFDGTTINEFRGERLFRHRARIGFIFQQFNLVKGLTVLENVMLPAYPLGLDHRQLRETALKLLRQFNMDPKADSKVEWLSGGEAQRTAICRALINDPEILIADEPTANLDTRLSREFMVIIRDLKQQGKTVIVTSHDPVVFEYAGIDTVVEMRDGILAEA